MSSESEAEEDEAKEISPEPEVEKVEQPVEQNMDDQEEMTGRTTLLLLCRRDDSGEKVKVLVQK